ncbi:MAG: SLAC1 anion channel family protein [Burkholderiales bacterium]
MPAFPYASSAGTAPAGAGPLLHRIPAAAFASVMGLAGLALAWHRAAAVFAAPPAIATAIGVLAGAVYLLLLAAYAARALRTPQDLRAEWHHPVKSAFAPTLSIGLLLLGTLVSLHAPAPGALLWGAGALAHLAMTLRLLAWWINHPELEAKSVTPAWFIAPVGNIVVPLAGVRLGYTDVSWFFFATGIVLWLPLLAIVLWRLYFAGPLPERLRPTLVILLAPPAVGFLAWTSLIGGVDAFGRVLYGFALFVLLLVFTQARALLRLPFFLSWWAWSFPMAAITIATMAFAQTPAHEAWLPVAGLMLASTTAMIAFLFLRTLAALARREPQFLD